MIQTSQLSFLISTFMDVLSRAYSFTLFSYYCYYVLQN